MRTYKVRCLLCNQEDDAEALRVAFYVEKRGAPMPCDRLFEGRLCNGFVELVEPVEHPIQIWE